MKFKDNCVFKLYDLKKNSKFFDKDVFELPEDIFFKEDDKTVRVYGMEEGITELLELIYDKAFKYEWITRNEYWSVSICFTDNSYSFENAIDALEVFRNKNINDLESVRVYTASDGRYRFTDFVISHDEGIVKEMEHGGWYQEE